MRVQLLELRVRTRQTTESVIFSPDITFIHGPVGTGKSTVARLIDYCFGGHLDRTPALQKEFVAVELSAIVGSHNVSFERSAADTQSVRVTWQRSDGGPESLNAPLGAGAGPILDDDVYNLSDLIFHLAGVPLIKVRKRKRDPDSELVRLSFRDLLWYCYLRQDDLDSSFFRLDDIARRPKSMDVMRFVTGLYSERMNELEIRLADLVAQQRAKREAVVQLRRFLDQFQMGSELDIVAQLARAQESLAAALAERESLEREHSSRTHAVEPLREKLREMSARIDAHRTALADLRERIQEQKSLRSELVAAKVKSWRVEAAWSVLGPADFDRCPRCGSNINEGRFPPGHCWLCGSSTQGRDEGSTERMEALRRDLNARIDDLAESIARHERELRRQEAVLARLLHEKEQQDRELEREIARYDSAFVSQIRGVDRRVASLEERISSLREMTKVPEAIDALQKEAGELQADIDGLRDALEQERRRLQVADENIRRLEAKFLDVMLQVGFPGVESEDRVEIDPRTWMPTVIHGEGGGVTWTFSDAGSGGKKTLFNVCYALAVHEVALEADLPLPTFLIIDSPTKNISRDMDPQLVGALYRYIYELAARWQGQIQFLLIDSDLVLPETLAVKVATRLMSMGDPDNPPLISYYVGP